MEKERQAYFNWLGKGYFEDENIYDFIESINNDINVIFGEIENECLEERDELYDITFEEITELKIALEKFKTYPGLLGEFLNKNIAIDSDFAYNAKRFDVICPSCFFPKNEFGALFIKLLQSQDYKFVLNVKVYKKTNVLVLKFIACKVNCFYDAIANWKSLK